MFYFGGIWFLQILIIGSILSSNVFQIACANFFVIFIWAKIVSYKNFKSLKKLTWHCIKIDTKKNNVNTETKSITYIAKLNRIVLETICCFVFEGPLNYPHYYSLLSIECQQMKDKMGKLSSKLGKKKGWNLIILLLTKNTSLRFSLQKDLYNQCLHTHYLKVKGALAKLVEAI